MSIDSIRPPADGPPPAEPGEGDVPTRPDPTGEGPISDRLGRDPNNLGDDVTESPDLVYPAPQPSEATM